MKSSRERAGAVAIELAWGLAVLGLVFRACFVGRLGLAPDEAYYWEWSRHLDWSYYDQGPMLAWIIHAGTAMLGVDEWGVRVGSLLAGFGISAIYIWMAKRLGKPGFAPWLVAAANTMLLFSVGGLLMMHDSLAAFFWSLGLMAAILAIQEDGRWWLAAGLAGGAAVLSKYTGVLLMPCLVLACASHGSLRQHLRQAWFWLGSALGAGMAGYPILRWNSEHDWPSLKHVASLGGGDASRVQLTSLPEFLGSQFALITPLLLWLILAALRWAWGLRRDASPQGALRWLLWCCSAPVLGLFLLISLHSRVEGNWPAPAYLAALPLAAWYLDERSALNARFSRWALGVAAAITLLVFSQAAWGWLPLPAPEAPRLDGTYRLQGWPAMAGAVAKARAQLDPSAFVACRTYQNAAELGFYLPDHAQAVILQNGEINHQYRFWNRPQDFLGRDAVLVIGQPWEVDEMRPMFDSVEPVGDVSTFRHSVLMRRTLLFVGRRFRGIPQ